MAVTVSKFNKLMEHVGKGIIKFNTDTFKAILVNGYTFDPTDDAITDIGPVEITAGNGYTTGGITLTGLAYAYNVTNNNVKWSANNVVWTATGGSIGPATGAIIVDTTANKVVMYIDFGGSQTATDASEFKLMFNSNGILTIA